MKIHVLQHVPFEGPGAIAAWAETNRHTIQVTHLYNNQSLPSPDAFDMLVVMGGPMGIYDTDQYPWLEPERDFIRQSIDAGKLILGVCLGAQQIAGALDAKVTKNNHREIGWFSVSSSEQQAVTPVAENHWAELFAKPTEVFHWHGDSFAIPEGGQLLASSEACTNQAFVYNDRVIGLQFHLETTPQSAALLIEHCGDELDDSHYVQNAEAMLSDSNRFDGINSLLTKLLDRLAATVG